MEDLGKRTARPCCRMSAVRSGAARHMLATALICVLASALWGCGDHAGVVRRYRAERMAWTVEKLEQAVAANPDLATEAMRADLTAKHRAIVESFRPPEGRPTDTERVVARISARSRFALAALAIADGDPDEATRWYTSVADSYAFDRELSLEALNQLARVRRAAGDWDGAVAVYRRLMDDWAATSEESGLPDSRVIMAPMRIAGGYEAQGADDEADAWYRRAREYYRGLMEKHPGSPTARAALNEIAESYVRQERWRDAVDTYAELDRGFGDEASRSRIWLTLAELYGDRLEQESTARDYYSRVESEYEGDVAGATASIAIARYDIESGRYVDARERLDRVLEAFGDDERIAATASYLLALSHELDGQWDAAAARYQSLARDFPATMYGLRAPLHVARHYKETGEMPASRSALSRAVEHYRVVIRDYGGTPAELAARGYLIDALVRLERWEQAADELVAVVDRYPDADAAPGMLLQAGLIQERELDDPARAGTLYSRVLESYPESERAADAAERLERMSGR